MVFFSCIVIVGGGIFGFLIVYYLVKLGYIDIIVIDKSEYLLLLEFVGNDFNKIICVEYEDLWYVELVLV